MTEPARQPPRSWALVRGILRLEGILVPVYSDGLINTGVIEKWG